MGTERVTTSADETHPLPTRERQRRDTRERILRVALAEIAEVGFSQARIEHIARKAGVTRPTIYAHFPTKEDFLHALETRTQERAHEVIRERLSGESEADLVHRLVDAIFDLVAGADPVLLREVFALIVREPARADWIGNPLFGFLTERFSDAQAEGEISSTVPAAELTRTVMTALFGFLAVDSEPAADRRRAAHRTVELIVRGAAS
jgi:AcrR family transcriptional regulator